MSKTLYQLVTTSEPIRFLCRYAFPNHQFRRNFYSNSRPEITFGGDKLGNADNDNARVINERRFVIEALGDEKGACPTSGRAGRMADPARIDGGWGIWSAWSGCDKRNQRIRTRDCVKPVPANGGTPCHGLQSDVIERKPCRLLKYGTRLLEGLSVFSRRVRRCWIP